MGLMPASRNARSHRRTRKGASGWKLECYDKRQRDLTPNTWFSPHKRYRCPACELPIGGGLLVLQKRAA